MEEEILELDTNQDSDDYQLDDEQDAQSYEFSPQNAECDQAAPAQDYDQDDDYDQEPDDEQGDEPDYEQTIPSGFVERANAELKELGARVSMAPSSLDELERHPKINEMAKLWQKGCNITQAYFAICANDVLDAESKVAYQHALNTIRGKGHLAPMGNASGVTAVPLDVKSAFKKMCPELTDAQISKEYKKYLADL